MDKIYTVTLVNTMGDTRCVAWYPTLKEARKGLKTITDEAYYRYAVIEGFKSGYQALCEDGFWYEMKGSEWVACVDPFGGVCNWGMG